MVWVRVREGKSPPRTQVCVDMFFARLGRRAWPESADRQGRLAITSILIRGPMLSVGR